MRCHAAGIRGAWFVGLGGVLVACAMASVSPLSGGEPPGEDRSLAPLFNWDLVSLEQNNPRFNASVLSGFHSVRSPGVTPHRAWKVGLGVLYSREQQVATTTNTVLFSRQQVILNPKINYGFYNSLEAGAGFEAAYTDGREPQVGPGGETELVPEEELAASAVNLGVKWGVLQAGRLRLGLSFDSRIAVNEDAFGALPKTLYNAEIDGDYAITSRFGVVTNVQYMTTDDFFEENQFVLDLGTTYTFSDNFRGMFFGTLQDDLEANDVLLFAGVAGQYVFEQHSFTLALDFQLNEADRDVRTQNQLDLEFSYTFTF